MKKPLRLVGFALLIVVCVASVAYYLRYRSDAEKIAIATGQLKKIEYALVKGFSEDPKEAGQQVSELQAEASMVHLPKCVVWPLGAKRSALAQAASSARSCLSLYDLQFSAAALIEWEESNGRVSHDEADDARVKLNVSLMEQTGKQRASLQKNLDAAQD